MSPYSIKFDVLVLVIIHSYLYNTITSKISIHLIYYTPLYTTFLFYITQGGLEPPM